VYHGDGAPPVSSGFSIATDRKYAYSKLRILKSRHALTQCIGMNGEFFNRRRSGRAGTLSGDRYRAVAIRESIDPSG
jgi:hypothetical protein